MLVLSRKREDRIVIDNEITVVVVEIRGDKVRLGVRAPKEIPVHRREVFEAIQRELLAGASGQPVVEVPDAQAEGAPVAQATAEEQGLAGFLVLSRKKNQSIIIGDSITIVVVEIRGDKVRLGIEAPKEVPVHRGEVYDAMHRKPEQA